MLFSDVLHSTFNLFFNSSSIKPCSVSFSGGTLSQLMKAKLVQSHLLFGTLIRVALLHLGLIPALLVDQDDCAQHHDLGADAQERPQGSEFSYKSFIFKLKTMS